MDNRASSFFALVRGCRNSSGLREFGLGHHISLLALVVILVMPHSALAQATATLNGVVRDSSSAVIPQATVTLQNTDTGTQRESLTNDSGLYVFVSVQPGEYLVRVTKGDVYCDPGTACSRRIGQHFGLHTKGGFDPAIGDVRHPRLTSKRGMQR